MWNSFPARSPSFGHEAPFLKRGIISCHYNARSAFTKQASLCTPEKKPPFISPESPKIKPRPPPAFSRPLSQSPENGTHICSLQYLRNKGVGEGSSGPEVNPASAKFPEDPGLTNSPASAGDHAGRLVSSR